MPRAHRGVTFIEILIGVSIISLLMGLTVPAMLGAKRAARSAVCANQQKRLHAATLAYSVNDNEWIPGVNRTGLKYRASINAALQLEGDTTSSTPTTTYDWISPVIGEDAKLSPNRAKRTKQIFEDLGCPEAQRLNDKTYGYSNDLSEDFLPLMEREGIGQISYLSPAPFHLAGPGFSPTKYERYPFPGPAVPPKNYLPRLERVGKQHADKIFLADGTRYLTAGGVLDFDVSPNPEYYGSFTSSTPIYEGSTAYGTGPATPGFDIGGAGHAVHAERRRLSYRHSGAINVMYFDGHYAPMTEDESKTDASPWYPSGSEFTGERATAQSAEFHAEGEILN